jgi:hypothetical protein
MRTLAWIRGAVALVAGVAAGSAWAAAHVLVFPELSDPPSHAVEEPFPPQPPLPVGTVNFSVPAGERVVAATISGFWGTSLVPDGTAGVDVRVDGILVAQCVKPSADCWQSAAQQRPWSYTFSATELVAFNDGVASMTAVQTSDISVRLGTSTLIIETGPLPAVPALSTLGLLALIAGLAGAGVFLVRRATR